jgi:hypothetical protein
MINALDARSQPRCRLGKIALNTALFDHLSGPTTLLRRLQEKIAPTMNRKMLKPMPMFCLPSTRAAVLRVAFGRLLQRR